MQTSLKFFSIAGALVITAAAGAACIGTRPAASAPVVQLESVTVVGHRGDALLQDVVQLEPVTVTGHRSEIVLDDVVQLEPVTVIGHREPTWTALLTHVAQRWHATRHAA